MFFVIDKPKLQRIIAVVRDDRTPQTQGVAGPFMRMEARDDYLKLDGLEVSAKFPATVYEPGVLFLRITRFRRLLRTIAGQKTITIQVNRDGLLVDNVTMPLEAYDMLLYPNPDQAPPRHPDEPEPGEAGPTLVDNVALPPEPNDTLPHPNPDQAPPRHPDTFPFYQFCQPEPGEAGGDGPTLWDIKDKGTPQ
jgi:hypothetical protein